MEDYQMVSWPDRPDYDDTQDDELLRELEALAALLLARDGLARRIREGPVEPRDLTETPLQWPPEARNRGFGK